MFARLASAPVALVMPARAAMLFWVLEARCVLVLPVLTAEACSATTTVSTASTCLARTRPGGGRPGASRPARWSRGWWLPMRRSGGLRPRPRSDRAARAGSERPCLSFWPPRARCGSRPRAPARLREYETVSWIHLGERTVYRDAARAFDARPEPPVGSGIGNRDGVAARAGSFGASFEGKEGAAVVDYNVNGLSANHVGRDLELDGADGRAGAKANPRPLAGHLAEGLRKSALGKRFFPGFEAQLGGADGPVGGEIGGGDHSLDRDRKLDAGPDGEAPVAGVADVADPERLPRGASQRRGGKGQIAGGQRLAAVVLDFNGGLRQFLPHGGQKQRGIGR